MRAVTLLCVCACVAYGQDINAVRNMPKYDARYDYLEVDAVLDSKRLVRNYVDCLINAKPCTPEGKALKRILPEALRTKCARCTDKQKRTAVKIIRRLKYEYPDEWAKLSVRWDPTGDFTRYFEEYLANEDFNTISNTANDYAPPVQPLPPRPRPTYPPPPRTNPPTAAPAPEGTTTPRALTLNRFGDEGELVVGSASGPAAPSSSRGPPVPAVPAQPPSTKPNPIASARPTRPTQMTWAGAASDVFSTRFPMRPTNDMPPAYTTAMTLIDQIGLKIIRTTELVTDILRNTVRAVVG